VLVHSGQVKDFAGSLDDYPQWLSAQSRQGRAAPGNGESVCGAALRKEKKRQEAEQRRQLQPLRERIAKAEAALASVHARRHELERRLAESNLYLPANKTELNTVLIEKAELDRQGKSLEGEWLAACEQLEAQQGAIGSG
jgi:ATP-binding cassette subfamily F protein 3